ncbi:hypothetical protein [Pseudomonas chlororaphis]|uniref:hypothetical protein n=1 Tax=Pseudomonas chlororaphis TaxID=587753 RepID=UPI003D0A720B
MTVSLCTGREADEDPRRWPYLPAVRRGRGDAGVFVCGLLKRVDCHPGRVSALQRGKSDAFVRSLNEAKERDAGRLTFLVTGSADGGCSRPK